MYAALGLRLPVIHRPVGVRPQFTLGGTVGGIEAHADRTGHADFVSVYEEGLLQPFADPVEISLEFGPIGNRRKQDHEFVAAQSRKHVRRPQPGPEAFCNLDQKPVTGGVTIVVVDMLEAVDVDECQGKSIRFGIDQRIDTALEQGPVWNSRKLIEIGFSHQDLFTFLLLGIIERQVE